MANDILPEGRDVAFAQIESTLARLAQDARRTRHAPARARTATVIVVGPKDRLPAAAEALGQLAEAGGVRGILISEGDEASPKTRVTDTAIAIDGLAPRYLNNAVAALRLSSLPALVWWRGGATGALEDLADLSDRMVLDVDEPREAWARASGYLERTALTDIRWSRLTRWRSALAHLFDLPQVLDAAASLERLTIEASDPHAARLFAGWLRARLQWTAKQTIAITSASRPAAATPLARVALEGPNVWIALEVNEAGDCLAAKVDGVDASARIVPLGAGSLVSLIGEELSVRTRDLAFEEALAAAQELSV